MHRVGVIGDRDSVLGFKAVGVDVFPCGGTDEAKNTLHKIAVKDYAIIFITERFAKDMIKDIDRYKNEKLPAIAPIPGRDGSYGVGFERLKKSVERAVGVDVLFGGDR